MRRVLIVDDDLGTCETFACALRDAGFAVQTAETGRDALACLRATYFDAALVDIRLPDISGVEILRDIRARGLDTRAVVMTGFGSIASAVEATRLGALDYLEKPIDVDAVVGIVRRALAPQAGFAGDGGAVRCERPLALRWAAAVVSVLEVAWDPRTLEQWAAIAAVSGPTLRNRCHAAGVSAKASLDFARLLRAVYHAGQTGHRIDSFLDADPRTLARLCAAAGFDGSLGHTAASARDYVDRQRLISDAAALAAVCELLACRSLSVSKNVAAIV
jgi:ActR/RegA family two-component response regulator